ncbi:STAS domain-containing protein [Actinomadura graeca]|uniref:Anti-sigma factor antagonist n=1 Tax=Actinomadura graeca TaxID=2750812 RepID=A0ABX8QTT7_9ACTN|nr:STAS domain-containing protein [Actinomadura graeca]QXJ22240.1 STAS domain-containing protein [Actinomadura graeca]
MTMSAVRDGDSLSEPQWRDPRDRIRVRAEHRDSALVAYAEGELDYLVSEPFRDYVLSLAFPPWQIILDLERVSFCDSSGLGAMVGIWKAVRTRRGRLVVSRPSGLCRRILRRTGLDEHFTVSATLNHALTQFAKPPGQNGMSVRSR